MKVLSKNTGPLVAVVFLATCLSTFAFASSTRPEHIMLSAEKKGECVVLNVIFLPDGKYITVSVHGNS